MLFNRLPISANKNAVLLCIFKKLYVLLAKEAEITY